jgi:uncharacterized protein
MTPRRSAGVAAAVLAGLAFVLVAALSPSLLAAPEFPELTGRVVDNASIITAEDRAAIDAEMKALEEKSTDQIAVLTTPSLQGYEIEDFGYQLGRTWGIGQKDKDNGAILIVAPNERKVRIEIGRGLEPLLTDYMSKTIVDNTILPAFRRGDFSGGIRAGVRDMKDVLLGDAAEVEKRARGGLPGPDPDWVALIFIAIWIAIFLYVIYAQYRAAGAAQPPMPMDRRSRRYRRNRAGDGGVIVIPGGSSDWSGGGWSGGGGGDWSGGGGDFGGGGASGGW